jgi:DNA-binding NtrC family response regulator
MAGSSAEMRRLYPIFERLAATRVHVVIEGESGTGKELLAECLHESGPSAQAPFVVVDCSHESREVLEAEIFGSGTDKGALELAHGGSLVLDEIAELDVALQQPLLRALERREATRAGTTQKYACDVRVLVTSRRDLDREVHAGRVREDLLGHLAVARIEMPPLRKRRGDVDALARHFARELGGGEIARDVLDRWRDEPWPGNVRELRQRVLRRLTLGDLEVTAAQRGTAPTTGGLSTFVASAVDRDRTFSQAREELLRAFEAAFVERMLAKHKGNVVRAASASGLARRYFQILKARAER